ncbi:hypothetical protein GLOIN_2v1846635 [Rhizophagus irregularis DAOM 181602=DAOM 197198]|uniref:B30.2/SPRY domain-containing protein n=1 Tax=Rhizophagus irregularis (strain DAOM 181602 / DAOM 197198 / MUCL 43194) TaxID=747089 RepID=A0A2P4P9X1_RHIID|nr:hypothetical protein GLOIN_2v1846635 [Rhizophagus irregularis DAOM 181602=DAOM 197198]POG62189.1 hypothetical protein GLOIN_2v1846635 [Rhizophagus irregularis DAOM 181602=DAOM 197198]|eukprot:XP_025169055.1 hypothetical protein GLOIN_2v1846635 [Rhizophagus irregularis DAOM 181602=DAOM 197198]
MHFIAFLIVNLAPIAIALCNIFKFDYFLEFGGQILIELSNGAVSKYIEEINKLYLRNIIDPNYKSEIDKVKDEINEISSKYYIREYIPLVIILGIFQFTLILICVSLSRSWKWIRKSKLNDNQRSHFIDRITNREDLIIAIILIFSLIILIINTWLCQRYIDEKVILQIYGPKNKQILLVRLLQNIKETLKDSFKKFLKFLGKKPKSDEYYLKRLGIKAWKFTPESRFLSLNIVRIDDKIVRVENEEDEVESVYNGETDKIRVVDNDKNDDIIIKISFNAKSDVMIQTNYPLFNINKALNMQYPPPIEYWFYYYEITILSNPNNDQTIIAIGLATKNYSINRLPGCDTHSVGFHSDEGRTFHNEGYTGSKYAEKWGKVDDVIGCGYCPNTGQIFFTMNGKNLGIAYTSLFYNWYPTIGSNGFCSLNVNFGQKKFKYKEANGMSVAGIISQELLNKVEEIIDVDKLN